MSESLHLSENLSKEERYIELLPQLNALVETDGDLISNLANVSAALKEAFDFFWVGFYLVKSGQLILGPFQGPVACTTIQKGKGVCGKAWESKNTIVVDDVDAFPGHIACNSASKSEIVLPIFNQFNEVAGVLDVDSSRLRDFDAIDQEYLQKVIDLLKI